MDAKKKKKNTMVTTKVKTKSCCDREGSEGCIAGEKGRIQMIKWGLMKSDKMSMSEEEGQNLEVLRKG